MARIIEPAIPKPTRDRGTSAITKLGKSFLSYASILLLILCWETAARSGVVSPYMLPSPTSVLTRIWTNIGDGVLLGHAVETLRRTFLGFGIAVCGGIGLGLLIARNSTADTIFSPIISLAFPLPKIAFLPIFILWFGVYDASKVTMIVCDAIFPVITATIAGAQSVERQLIWSARNLGAKERDLWHTIIIPAALPMILSGVEVALPLALIIAVATEMYLGGTGFGGMMMGSWRFADSTGVFAGLIVISVTGFVLIQVMSWIRRKLLSWHPETEKSLFS